MAGLCFSLEHLGLTAEIDEFFLLPSARGNEAARDFYRRQGYSERSGFELLDKMLPQ